MVQELLRAKQELVLDKLLKKFGKYDVAHFNLKRNASD
jgi:hypothetical protein